jgi:hypothetical protein
VPYPRRWLATLGVVILSYRYAQTAQPGRSPRQD